jgi:hypothetical protein
MRIHDSIGLAVILLIATLSTAAFAASADDFKTAYARAEAANKQAAALKNQWTTTASELNAARAAADAGDYAAAVADAEQAEALAKASIAQAKEQATAWKQAVIH